MQKTTLIVDQPLLLAIQQGLASLACSAQAAALNVQTQVEEALKADALAQAALAEAVAAAGVGKQNGKHPAGLAAGQE